MSRRLNYNQIGTALADREPFQGNSMSAEYVATNSTVNQGWLSDHGKRYLEMDMWDAHKQGVPFYVVYSYSTPIAWAWGVHVTVPEERHSVTTSKQQSIVKAYLR